MSRKWAEAKTPLSPNRLAKIANALGVSTPVPSSSSSSSPRTSPSTSKYLIHVVPPLNLPHLNTSLSSPPPPSASGYHTHFRRGTLLPVHPTLQLQLTAIAREYALPSTAGVILYLVNDDEDPGPRISDDIWKHLWSRVWKAEFASGAPEKLPVLTLASPRTDQSAPPTTSSSPPSIPIIAKVEFDIDLRSASWFNPWITSRNLNHNKRVENKNSPVPLFLPKSPQSESQLDEEDFILRLVPTMHRKNIPSPLVLEPLITNATNSSSSLPSSGTSLPYLRHQDESDDDTEIDDDSVPASGKRGGGVYDDLELDFDESFEEDTKESQYLLTAKLDEIEKNLAQFSPRVLQLELQEDQAKTPLRTEVSIASPIQPSGAWPSVPFQSLHSAITTQPSNSTNPSPPRLALNGVTTSAPQPFNLAHSSTGTEPSETTLRKQMEEEESKQIVQEHYPRHTPQINGSFKDAVIPLSPDPFGRYPSTPTPSADSRGSAYWDDNSTAVDESKTTSSRFSADSAKDNTPTNRATMMSVKSIKKLWRRSNKQSVSSINVSQPPSAQQGRISPQVPGPAGISAQAAGASSSIPNGASAHRQSDSSSSRNSVGAVRPPPIRMSTSQTSTSTSSSVPPSRPARPSRSPSLHNFDIPGMSAPAPTMFPQHTISLDRLRFDQESPYPNPTRRARSQLSGNGKVSPTLTSGKSTPISQSGKNSPTHPPQTETQRNSVRKSILKWKNAASGGGLGARRPSVSMLSVNVEPRPSIEKMPPSPRIPDEFLQHQQHSRLPSVAKSVTSVAPSMTKSFSSRSSRYSDDEGRGPSIDDQFEIVSPKMTPGSLTYPYTTLDEQDTSRS
ncbi:hypothetical protein ARMSODRAFT_1012080 [Armillaria solidipes]|uniref:Uncharacterized protein n=1 Tax=Armillaria solidipes TaxID=1076256 RepID=A0A2H3CEQ3_9AGAR|nr:hypothetical protein ARMSODRAFT_1012080 [Armillaria solidipes]